MQEKVIKNKYTPQIMGFITLFRFSLSASKYGAGIDYALHKTGDCIIMLTE